MRRILLLVVMVVAAGCGVSDGRVIAGHQAPVRLAGPVNDAGYVERTAGDLVTVDLDADDIAFAPTFVRVRPLATVIVRVRNRGTINHGFYLPDRGLGRVLRPGESVIYRFRAPRREPLDAPDPHLEALGRPNVLEWFCNFHRSYGMRGGITVASA